MYASFYGTLGASPEEVGIDATQAITVSAVPILAALLLSALVRVAAGTARGRARIATYAALVIALVSVTVFVEWQTNSKTSAAYAGERVTSVNIGPIQVLALRAEPAHVRWIGSVPPGEERPIDEHDCYMYLGQSNSVVVLFDPGPTSGEAVRTLRFPQGDVAVEVVRGEHQATGSPLLRPACKNRTLTYE